MEPFALASFAIGAAVSGIVGNRADDVLCQVMRDITERLRRGEPAVNHDIQRAVRKAYLQATLAVCELVQGWIKTAMYQEIVMFKAVQTTLRFPQGDAIMTIHRLCLKLATRG